MTESKLLRGIAHGQSAAERLAEVGRNSIYLTDNEAREALSHEAFGSDISEVWASVFWEARHDAIEGAHNRDVFMVEHADDPGPFDPFPS